MPAPLPKFPAAKFAPLTARPPEEAGGPLLPWDFCSPPSSPPFRAPPGAGLRSFPETSCSPAEGNRLPEKMWKARVLLLVLGSALLWARTGATTVLPEDDATTASMESSMVTSGVDDNAMIPGAGEQPHKPAGFTSQVPTNTKRTDTPIEDLPTTESTGHAQEETQSTTALSGATSHSREDTQTTGAKDGFSTGTLIGIIVGVLLAIGFIAGIIIVVVRKMSGRP
ncbi:podoplanin isoform X2 [Myotis myotis]|uniref:Podoplanin n=1 Tax=Myotis myotis TaxID=51298 RepID=A0A7J8A0E6_MYOMY|nr:podoplanin isoform X2 [Myotis myotis]KAF6379765.1 podoplanin [Myotis myotis]